MSFHLRDSAIRCWFINLGTQTRFLTLALRKKELCKCGCRGWCSLYMAFDYLRWLCAAMASGSHPDTRQDGQPWPDEDPIKEKAGQPLGYYAAVVMVKADWAEFCHTIGFPSWAHHTHPCFACHCSGGPEGDVRQYTGASALALPWAAKKQAEYEAACRAAEIRVEITSRRMLQRLLGSMEYMVRKGAGTGRRIVIAVPEFGLQVQDQQVPSPENPDIGDIDDRTDFPFVVVFWRGSPGVFTRCRNPLFHESTYITVESLCVDEVHTMHFGVFASFVVHGLWALLSANVWNFSGSQEQMHARGAHVVAHELSQWYKREGRNNPGKPIYKLGGEFTLSVIGKQTAPVLHAKAAETGTLVAFVTWLCKTHRAKLEHGNAWVRAGDALLEYLAITRRAGPQLSPADRQE